jgi:hypothetical protein
VPPPLPSILQGHGGPNPLHQGQFTQSIIPGLTQPSPTPQHSQIPQPSNRGVTQGQMTQQPVGFNYNFQQTQPGGKSPSNLPPLPNPLSQNTGGQGAVAPPRDSFPPHHLYQTTG